MGKVGMPYVKLDRNDHFGEKGHAGNARAVVCEGLEERQSSDPDLDRTKTAANIYAGYRSGEDLLNFWNEQADSYIITDRKGRKRHLRSDANIGFACICKPGADYINSLSRDEQIRFFQDSLEIMSDMFESRGMVVDAAVVHMDEGAPHMHVYGHDPDYKMGKKFDLKMRDQMNRAYYPAKMRERGWDVEDLPRTYDPDYAKTLDDDALTEYKATCKAKRKDHGKSAKTYKADKDATKIKAEAERQAQQILEDARREASVLKQSVMDDLQKRQADLEEQRADYGRNVAKTRNQQLEKASELKNRENILAVKEKQMEKRATDLDARETSLNAREAILNEQAKKNTSDAKEVLKSRLTLSEREKAVKACENLIPYARAYDNALQRKAQQTKDAAERDRIERRRRSADTAENIRIVEEYNRQHTYDGISL